MRRSPHGCVMYVTLREPMCWLLRSHLPAAGILPQLPHTQYNCTLLHHQWVEICMFCPAFSFSLPFFCSCGSCVAAASAPTYLQQHSTAQLGGCQTEKEAEDGNLTVLAQCWLHLMPARCAMPIKKTTQRFQFTFLCMLSRYLVSQDSVVPVKALLGTLAKRFPQFKFPTGKDAPVKKVIDNSKVNVSTLGCKVIFFTPVLHLFSLNVYSCSLYVSQVCTLAVCSAQLAEGLASLQSQSHWVTKCIAT